MTLKFFIENYDFNDFEIDNVVIKDNNLKLYAKINAHLELIANGYRPEFDVIQNSLFIFKTNHKNHKFRSPFNVSIIEYNNTEAILKINDEIIKILDENISVSRY